MEIAEHRSWNYRDLEKWLYLCNKLYLQIFPCKLPLL